MCVGIHVRNVFTVWLYVCYVCMCVCAYVMLYLCDGLYAVCYVCMCVCMYVMYVCYGMCVLHVCMYAVYAVGVCVYVCVVCMYVG